VGMSRILVPPSSRRTLTAFSGDILLTPMSQNFSRGIVRPVFFFGVSDILVLLNVLLEQQERMKRASHK